MPPSTRRRSTRAGATTGDAPSVAIWDRGFRLRGGLLRFDAERASEMSFVSSAARARRHARMLCSERTLELLQGRSAVRDALPSPFGRALSLGPLRLELFPSGHVLGAAQVLVETKTRRLVYCGGFQPQGSLTAEKFQVRPCDVLLLDCPYDAPGTAFPPAAEVHAALLSWVRATLEDGRTPVLLASALGKAQELVHLLGAQGLPLRAHAAILRWTDAYRRAGVALASPRPLRGAAVPGEVSIVPPHLAASGAIAALPRASVALVSGRALDDTAVRRAGASAGFALSSHGDHAALLELVRATGATQVFLSPRHGAAFELVLKGRGIATVRVHAPEQLRLL